MPTRKKSKKANPLKGRKAGRGPQAAEQNWQSVQQGRSRLALYLPPAQDLSRDLSRTDRLTMLKKCRWADRNSGLFRQILNDCTTYACGDGIRGQSLADDPAKAEAYEEFFNDACRSIDIAGRFSFWEAQSMMLRSALRDGDSFVLAVNDEQGRPKLQFVEAHRVGDPLDQPERIPGLKDGVRFGAFGQVVEYYIQTGDGRFEPRAAGGVMHIADLESVSAARGVPLLQHSINSLQDEMEILALERVALKDNSDVTRVLKRVGGFIEEDRAAEMNGDEAACGNSRIESQFGGKLITLNPGEDFSSFASARPSPTFQGFLTALEKDITLGSIPMEFVTDPSKLGGASVRLVTGKAARFFSRLSQIIIEKMCVRTWAHVIGTAIDRGELPYDENWWKTSWTPPRSLTVDAGRDAANDRNDVEMGLLSISEVYQQRGLDFRSELKKRAEDMAYIIKTAQSAGIPVWMLYKPGFNWLQQGQANDQIPGDVAQNLDLPPAPPPQTTP